MTRMVGGHEWLGRTIVDSDGEKLGRISAIYLADETDQPEWATVKVNLLGTDRHLPLAGATPAEQEIRAAVTGEQVKNAPDVDPGGVLGEFDETQLLEHYRTPEE